MPVRLGTSSWSADSWVGPFYPAGTAPADYIASYATKFDTVEVDATFYRIPSPQMIQGWVRKTPPGFLFAAKAPQVITHEKKLVGVEDDLNAFLKVMDGLGDRLGPILFQFPYFKKAELPSPVPFFDAIRGFVKLLPAGRRFVIEVRNKNFLVPAFLDTLRGAKIALALIDHPYMLPAAEYRKRSDLLTSDFVYVRWLGDRYGIEKITQAWDKVVVDRTRETEAWVPAVRDWSAKSEVYGYFNNHYSGHAPASIALFRKIWDADAATRV